MTHIHRKTKTFLLTVTVTLLTQTSHSGLTIHIVLLYLHSTSLQEVPVGYDKQKHPTSIKTLPHWAFPFSSFLKLYNCWWKRLIDIITSTGQKIVPTAWHDNSGNVFVFGNYCADGARSQGHAEILLVNTRTVFHGLLQKHNERRQILSQTQVSSTFQWQ